MEPSPGTEPTRPPAPRSFRTLAELEVPVGAVLPWVSRNRTAVLLGFGVLFRLVQYLANRSLWLDEGSLKLNIVAKGLAGMFGPLANTQLAPPGFLVIEWGAFRVLGEGNLALRLFPLISGIASLFLFQRVAVRCLRPRGVEIGLALFAVSGDLIYYASELKQYSSDVAVGLLCTLQGIDLLDRPATAGRLAGFAALGAAAVWFSHPSAFVLAGVGTVLIVSALRHRRWRTVLGLGLVVLAWLASFVGVYLVAQEQLGHHDGMWRFWDFAFPPMPPRSLADASWDVRRVLFLFVNPLDFHAPLGPSLSFWPAFACFVAGCAVMLANPARRAYLGMIVGPLLFVLAASHLRLYPFHGRLVLFLVPSLLLPVGEGAAAFGERVGRRWAWIAILAVLLLFPTLRALAGLVDTRQVRETTRFGDLRPSRLDPRRFPF